MITDKESLRNMTLDELWELFPIVLAPHNPKWREWANDEIKSLAALLESDTPVINHIGSTSVPDIQAKPIIDLLAEVPVKADFNRIKSLLEDNGYICMAEDCQRLSFNKGYTPKGYAEKVFHIHVHRVGDRDEILFRDYLLSHPDTAKEYERLKLSLLPGFKNNRDGYTEAKTDFVRAVVSTAKQTRTDFMKDTKRLHFRPWHENDAEALYKYASDARVSELALWPRHTSVEISRQVIREFFMPNEHTFAIVLKETDEPIGCIGLVPVGAEHYKPLANEREVGYWIGFPYWGKGLTSEALISLIEFCFNNLRLDSLLITTDATNKASRRVAEKCGFVNFAEYDNNGTLSKAFRLRLPSLAIRKVEDGKRDFMDMLLIGDE